MLLILPQICLLSYLMLLASLDILTIPKTHIILSQVFAFTDSVLPPWNSLPPLLYLVNLLIAKGLHYIL